MSHHPLPENLSAEEALARLAQGNAAYVEAGTYVGDVSAAARAHGAANGQAPYAIVITCSDSRVVPEAIFGAGLGDLFVIRLAGNVIDDHQLGSIEYAAGHLGTRLILVMGHTHCGAVDAAINHDPDGYVKFITDQIKDAIGEETDPYRACCLNVANAITMIEGSLEIREEEAEDGLCVAGAVYDIETGIVEFL